MRLVLNVMLHLFSSIVTFAGFMKSTGPTDGQVFIAMAYYEGETLKSKDRARAKEKTIRPPTSKLVFLDFSFER